MSSDPPLLVAGSFKWRSLAGSRRWQGNPMFPTTLARPRLIQPVVRRRPAASRGRGITVRCCRQTLFGARCNLFAVAHSFSASYESVCSRTRVLARPHGSSRAHAT